MSRPGSVGRHRFEADFSGEIMNTGKGPNDHGTAHITVDVEVVR